ncbi:MAG TPA: winged helix-turn-helix transcriptional regulator [Anaerolineae bacterium]|nr:winged helix-turn-helix transcriptional regulator [Anaerolineae bacterium]HMR67459.1 winged helix-turn-helix transcriptional regulator [Anaerolineae bacterium]
MYAPDSFDLQILSLIEENPNTTQLEMAERLEVSVGTINWHLKRLIGGGWIKVTRMQRRRLRYLLTPIGLEAKNQLMREYLHRSLSWYRRAREASKLRLAEVKAAGYDTVYVEGEGDLAEIVYLSCLEAGVQVKKKPTGACPTFRIQAWQPVVEWPAE